MSEIIDPEDALASGLPDDETLEQVTVSPGRYIFQSPLVDIWQNARGVIGFMVKTGVPFFGLDPQAAATVAAAILAAVQDQDEAIKAEEQGPEEPWMGGRGAPPPAY